MPGPGEYLPDATEGITRIEDLPKPKISRRSRNFRRQPCPRCGHSAYRHRQAERVLHDLGELVSGRPHDIHLTYSVHCCTRCRRYFNADMSDLALPKSHYTHQVVALAVRLVVEDGLPYLARKKEPLGRGRPRSKEAKRAARRNGRLQQKIGDLFEHRHLFVAHHLTPAQRRTVQRITRGLSQLRTLREIMDEVYRLFDRRCRTDRALAKLAKLRMRVRRFRKVGKTLSKLFSPNLEKALTFLDDRLLPPTSNAVERGNRRHRKMQKTVYRVRTQEHIHARIAIDMLRDAQAHGRFDTTRTLHHARAG